jgi:hypothetical protein
MQQPNPGKVDSSDPFAMSSLSRVFIRPDEGTCSSNRTPLHRTGSSVCVSTPRPTDHGQCDWWVSAAGDKHLRAFAAGLLELPGLRGTLWSNDDTGASLLAGLLGEGRL